MARNGGLICLFFTLILVPKSTGESPHEASVKRSDDVSLSSLETLVQQQAALIQTLQTKVNVMETRLTAVEQDRPKPVTSCPDGWTQFQSSCYGVGDEALTFGDALEVCEWFGGGLAEIGSSEENEFVKQIARSHSFGGTWLGAADILSEGHWVWLSTKESLSSGGVFTDWYPGQPANDGGDEDCLVTWKPPSYQWADLKCFSRVPFVCEVKLEKQ